MSVARGIIECMFEVDPAIGPLQRMCSAARAEACAAAQRLVAIGDLVSLRMAQDGGASEDWALDVTDAVAIEVSAALNISRGLAASHVRYAHALRVQLPKLGRAFIAGDIDEAVFRAAVFRTGLITDDDILAAVDEQLSVRLPRWGVMSRRQLAARIDKIVARVDRGAVRRRRGRVAGREVFVGDVDNGLAELSATLFAADAHAVVDRLTALAHTVCDDDPRTVSQRCADAFGALSAGADRLACHCGTAGCPAGGRTAGPVVIHVVADQSTIDGTGTNPGAMLGYEGLIPPELIVELAKAARLRPLVHPCDSPPECGYTPSRALSDFVRCRDLTCRFPGCDVPAVGCDLDHTIPHGDGGPTHASNLKCLCRFHHLLKTFWGWGDRQLRDGTVVWTSPAGETYATTPGSALLFPDLCVPTGPLPASAPPRPRRGGDRTAKMPRRHRTRTQEHAHRIAVERRQNRQTHCQYAAFAQQRSGARDPDPPPF